jgi:hypothetical protein
MLQTSILDVAIGVVFTFLAISLVTSAIVEAVASLLRLRARFLLRGIEEMLNDPRFEGLARALYAHALVNPQGPGAPAPARRAPAYIGAPQFAQAFLDVTGLTEALHPQTGGAPPAADLVRTVEARVADPQLCQALAGMVRRAEGDLRRLRDELAAWFDCAMDRLSGAYKRFTQAVSFAIALAVSVGVNADSVHIATRQWQQPALIAELNLPATQPNAAAAYAELARALPVGWTEGGFFVWRDDAGRRITTGAPWARAAIGWLITAIATLYGAPFWFDTLGRLARLRGADPAPARP